MELQLFETIAAVGTAGATIALVILLLKTIKQMETTVKLSHIQTEYRFRPWIGPSTRFQRIEPSVNEKIQFEITLKNFGELPASGVLAKFLPCNQIPSRQEVINNSKTMFELGPMLPNMEKRYWFFIGPEQWSKITTNTEQLFTGVYFEYSANGKKNGYGIISEYDVNSNQFIHKDMWIDNPSS